jgi:uncharacterized protein with HEPN domain
VLVEKLKTLLEALERIPRRSADIAEPADFYASEAGIDRMDAICMILIAAGEEFKNIDRKTEGKLLSRYPDVKWRGVMGVRDILVQNWYNLSNYRK